MLTPVQAEGVLVEDFTDDLCLYRPDVDEVLVLNQSAAAVWRTVDGTRDVEAISVLLAHEFGADVVAVRSGVEAAVADLLTRGFLHTTAPEGATDAPPSPA